MALSGTYENKKTRRLARALKMPPWAALGMMEAIWMWAHKSARTGRIDPDQWDDLADYLQWQQPTCELQELLTGAGFIDPVEGWFWIHDWHQHADHNLRRQLEYHGEKFANGAETRHWTNKPARSTKSEVVEQPEKVVESEDFRQPSHGRAGPVPVPVPVPVKLTPPPAAGARPISTGPDPQPELHAAVNRIAAFWPNPGRVPYAVNAACNEFGHGPPGQSVSEWTRKIESNAMLHADHHRRGRQANSKHFIPTLERWFVDGDYTRDPPAAITSTHTPQPKKQTATDILREKYAKEATEKVRNENAN